MITVAVEGDTDVPIARKLLLAAGLEVAEPIVAARGKSGLDPKIHGYARAAQRAPFGVIRDLDRDADCAPIWLAEHAPRKSGGLFALRLAVRAVEAWVLADVEATAAALAVPARRLPQSPDEEPDPKLTIVNLARGSSKAAIRRALVPAPGTSRKAGPEYERWLIELGLERWSVERAAPRSPSLARARAAFAELAATWREMARGGTT